MKPFREATRAPLEVPVRLKFDSFGAMKTGFTANVSRGGMFVSGAEPSPVGTLLKFELELGRSSTVVGGLGEVVWIRIKQRDLSQPRGMGVQFRHVDVEGLSLLDAAVRNAVAGSSVSEESVAPSQSASERGKFLLRELEETLAASEDRGSILGARKHR